MGSFLDVLKEKALTEQPIPQESNEAPEAQEVEVAELDQEAEVSEEQEQEVSEKISDKVKKELSGKESFLEKIKEAKALEEQEAADALALEEQEAADALALQETEKAEEAAPAPVTFKVDDQEFESPEQVNEYIAKVKTENAELLAEVEEIRGFVEKVSDPEFVEILRFIGEGYSWRVAMVKAGFDESLFKVDAGDQDGEALVRAKIEREQAIKDMEKEQKVLQKNMETSNANLSEFATEKGMDDTKKKTFVDQMAKVHRELTNGLVTKETLEIFAKGLNYESAVQKAAEAAALKAKNEKIVTEQQKKNAAALPNLRGKITPEATKRENRLANMVNIPEGSFMEMVKRNRN